MRAIALRSQPYMRPRARALHTRSELAVLPAHGALFGVVGGGTEQRLGAHLCRSAIEDQLIPRVKTLQEDSARALWGFLSNALRCELLPQVAADRSEA